MNASGITNSLTYLTTKSQNLLAKAQLINMGSGPNPYPAIIAGLDEIAITASNLASDVHGSDTIEGKDADAISEAFKEFVRVQQTLIHLLTSKAALFKTGGPVANELRVVKDAVESVAQNLNEHVPSKSTDFKTYQQSLSQTLRGSIKAHERAS
jgi:hypothetical protein